MGGHGCRLPRFQKGIYMKFNEIKIVPVKNGYAVRVDGDYASDLTIDEALGVVASALFGDRLAPLYVKTPEDHDATISRYRCQVVADNARASRDEAMRALGFTDGGAE